MPWHHFNSPLAKWAAQPSFLVGEYLFYLLAIIALVHAISSSRAHVLTFIAALIAGTANDVIFMALPLVDNFWQAQATVMLTARMPLYIPCVYICFMYFPTVAVRRIGLPPFARAALTGLSAAIFYMPYDIVGAKFLWWTWHDTDRPIANRLLGAPIGSTMWVVTFVAVFSFLINRAIDRDPSVRMRTAAKGIALVAGLSSLLMVLQMTALQQLDGGIPGWRGLFAIALIYLAIAVSQLRHAQPSARAQSDRWLFAGVVLYASTLVTILAAFRPETHVSLSVHQTYGACHVEAKDITGAVRYEFLCAEDFDEDFDFACVPELPMVGARWYTVCGRAHRNFASMMTVVAGLGLAMILLFAVLLQANERRPRHTRDPRA